MQSSPPPPIIPKSRRPSRPRRHDSTSPGPPHHQPGARLKQIQYRSYQCTIQIYHFRKTCLSLNDFRSLLNRDLHDYVDSLISYDALAHLEPSEGDKVPADCIEVAYMPNIFTRGKVKLYGCALGFRIDKTSIDWMCFQGDIEATILSTFIVRLQGSAVQCGPMPDLHPDDPRKLFDFVAEMPKGLNQRRVKGANEEHRLWHDALWSAKLRKVKLKLTWKNYTAELVAHTAAERAQIEVEEETWADREMRKELEDAMAAEKWEDRDVDVEMAGYHV